MNIKSASKYAFIGILCGIINGTIGSGGGILSVLLLTNLLKFDNKKAHATTILVILPLCIISSLLFIKSGYYNITLVLNIVIGSIIGGMIGAKLLSKLSNRTIKYFFGSVLIISAIRLMI